MVSVVAVTETTAFFEVGSCALETGTVGTGSVGTTFVGETMDDLVSMAFLGSPSVSFNHCCT